MKPLITEEELFYIQFVQFTKEQLSQDWLRTYRHMLFYIESRYIMTMSMSQTTHIKLPKLIKKAE